MRYLFFIFLLAALFQTPLRAQNLPYANLVIQELCSEKMAGRGYLNKADKVAAEFISSELKRHKTLPFGKNYFQKVSFPINTFPGEMQVGINSTLLKPVSEFVVSPNCKTISGTFPIIYLNAAADTIDAIYDSLINVDNTGKFIVAPFTKRKLTRDNPFKASGVIVPKKSLYWWASTGFEVAKTPLILIKDSLLTSKPNSISLNIENKFYKEYKSQNVVGLIPGSEKADSFIVFTAHYDHLGYMGKDNAFLGANDNASGTAMLLSLIEYFAKPTNRPKYTIAFLFFTGEEAGLNGSNYFVKNPLFDLQAIKALINLDMVGSGSEGIALVNGKKNTRITQKFQAINNEHNYFTDILVRGESCNSDHCYFDKVGVPAVFIYTRGKEHKEYHTLKDVPEILPLTKYSELFNLLVNFCE